ncbi:hypothetical protein AALP_AA8G018000 [Arabis alpina]|uniref:Uncharacterized protein n=1 Tax=Arabis alpina TaxID=50452 RepID=A0A087G4D5_ARAAL|nr:hypothetical protein AALP_AA8G018000 [Arabis alpina]
MPVAITQHREVRPITVKDPIGVGIFRRTLNIVTYYKQAGDDSGWLAAGWIKESLGSALTEQPMLAGRLRRRRTVDGGLEVVANDSGVRLVEAKFPASFLEFLEMVKRDKSRVEAETVFWKDIDEVDPQFSPLFYVQVTNFESGGYSIGISCSILIADIILGTDFLTKWAQLQSSLAHSKTTLKPIFYLPFLKQNLGNFLTDSRSASVLDRGEPVVFRAKTSPKMSIACMKKPVNVTREKASADAFLFIKEKGDDENSTGCDGTKVEIHSSNEEISDCVCGGDLEESHVGVLDKKLAFGERLEGTSCWIGSISKGVVFVVPSTFGDDKSVAKFIVALPKE